MSPAARTPAAGSYFPTESCTVVGGPWCQACAWSFPEDHSTASLPAWVTRSPCLRPDAGPASRLLPAPEPSPSGSDLTRFLTNLMGNSLYGLLKTSFRYLFKKYKDFQEDIKQCYLSVNWHTGLLFIEKCRQHWRIVRNLGLLSLCWGSKEIQQDKKLQVQKINFSQFCQHWYEAVKSLPNKCIKL